MAGKQFSVSFRINGALDGSLQAALQAASNAMRGLGNAARQASAAAQASRGGLAGMAAGLNQLQAAAAKFRELKKALAETQRGMTDAQTNADKMARKFREDSKAVERLRSDLKAYKNIRNEKEGDLNAARENLAYLRRQRGELYAQAKAFGSNGKKIPRELLGTRQGEQLAQVLKQLSANTQAIDEARTKFRAARDDVNLFVQKVREAERALKAQEQATRQSGRGFEDAKAKAAALKESLRQQQEALQRLRTSLGSQGFNTSSFAASERQLAAEIDRVNAALRQQQALTQARSQFNASATNLAVAGAGMMGAVYTAQQIAAPFQAAIDNAMTFEHSMSRVKALTQTGNIMAGNLSQVEAEMAKLEGQARQLGATTQFTMTQAADAMGYLGMAGWKTEQIYGTMPGMLNLAAGAGTDLARTADIVSDNMTAMGVPVEKAGHFMDVYAYALTNSNVNLESLGETMKYAAPVAAAFGATLEDTAAMTMMMGNAGIKGSMAGTALRMGLLRLSGPPKKASKALDEMGISVSDATAMAMEAEAELARLGYHFDENTDGMTKMQSIITTLSGKMATMTAEEKLASVSAIFGANAASGWINILEQGPEVFNEYLNALQNCDGYSEQFAKTMNDDTRGAMIALESAMDAVQNSIGTALLPAVRSSAEAFTPIASAIAIFIQEHPGVVQAAAAIAAALTLIVVGAAAVKLAFAGWTFITSTVALVQTSLASLGSGAMLGGVIARITALRTAMLSLTAAGGLATTGGWATMFAAISTKATAAATAIRTFFASLTLGSAASGIVATLSSIGTAIAGAARAAMAFAFSPIGVALMALALAGLYCYQNWSKIEPVLSNVAGVITGMFAPAVDAIMPAIRNLGRAFDLLAPAIQNAFSSGAFATIGSTIVQGLALAVTAVAGVAATIITAFSNVASTVIQILTLITGAIRNVFEGNWSAAATKIVDVFRTAVEGIKTLFAGLGDSISNIFDSLGKVRDIFNFSKDMPTVEAANRHQSSVPAQVTAPAAQPAQPPIDTSQTQAALDQVGNSAQNAATNLQGVDQAATGVQQLSTNAQTASAGVQQFGTSAQTASTGVQQLSTNATSAGAGVQQLGSNAQAAGGGIMSLSEAASGASGGVSALGSAASGAAGSVSGLGAAVQSACAALASAGANAAAAVASAAPKANYRGGIYKKGAFMTTFAEKSPEAAIPIDNSQRAIDLWTKTGQMLGQLPGKANSYESAPKDALGNLQDADEFNRVNEGDTIAVKRAKLEAQRRKFELQRMSERFADERIQAEQAQATAIQNASAAVTQAAAQVKQPDFATDELGNIKGLNVPEYNRINVDDDRRVRRAKLEAQRKQFETQRQAAQSTTLASQSTAQPAALAMSQMTSRMTAASERRMRMHQQVQSQPAISGNQHGALEGLSSGIGRQSNFGSTGSPTITFNITVNGNANADEVQRGVEQALPSVESLARQLENYWHEEARRSFA